MWGFRVAGESQQDTALIIAAYEQNIGFHLVGPSRLCLGRGGLVNNFLDLASYSDPAPGALT